MLKLTLCKARRHDPGLSKLSYELYTQPIFGTIVTKLLLGPITNPSMESKTNINFFFIIVETDSVQQREDMD